MIWREYSELIYPSKAKKKIRIHRTSHVIFCSIYYEKRLGLGRLKFRRTNGICVLSQNKDTRNCTIQYLRAIHPSCKPKVNWGSLSKILLIPIIHVRAWIFRIELPFLALLLNSEKCSLFLKPNGIYTYKYISYRTQIKIFQFFTYFPWLFYE